MMTDYQAAKNQSVRDAQSRSLRLAGTLTTISPAPLLGIMGRVLLLRRIMGTAHSAKDLYSPKRQRMCLESAGGTLSLI